MTDTTRPIVAILDDYQNVALAMADWSGVTERAEIMVLNEHVANVDMLARMLADAQVLCIMRERTPITRALMEKLDALRLVVTTGKRNNSIDIPGASALGIAVAGTESPSHATAELAFGLILSLARNIHLEYRGMRAGSWQTRVGADLRGKTLGIVGLGRLGTQLAGFGRAFGMEVIAWSPNLDQARAEAAGATRVEKAELFSRADFISVHMALAATTRQLVDAAAIGAMKPTAYLVNTSRAPLVDMKALEASLTAKKIAGAAIDVYDEEPLPASHALRRIDNLLTTPHIGYVTRETYATFYQQTAQTVEAWLDGRPLPFPLNDAAQASDAEAAK